MDGLLPFRERVASLQVLIFVQTVQMLRILEKFLDARGLRHVQLHGSVPLGVRQKRIDAFSDDDNIFCMCTRAHAVNGRRGSSVRAAGFSSRSSHASARHCLRYRAFLRDLEA